jgi:DNA-binding response OmpR family regulator
MDQIKTNASNNGNILILEDNLDCIEIYKDLLSSNYQLTFVSKIGVLAEPDFNPLLFNALLADMTLPDGKFLDWVMLSKSTIMEDIPTIIVSSLDDVETLRNSYEWGASDYLVKPFKKNELLVKLERILRNKETNVSLNLDNAFIDGLTLIENKIFNYMLQLNGKCIHREGIYNAIWKKVQVSSKTLDVHLSNLRKKMANSHWKIESHQDGWKLIKK